MSWLDIKGATAAWSLDQNTFPETTLPTLGLELYSYPNLNLNLYTSQSIQSHSSTTRTAAWQDKMDPGIEQALISLIPSISGRPPTELVQLATSLLAQSRTRASSLKADEEIARNYACANLACER